MEQRASNFQLKILENRIQKLQLEELRAKHKIELAQEKVKQLEDQKREKIKKRETSDYRQRLEKLGELEMRGNNQEERYRSKSIIQQVKRLNISF